MRFLLAILAWLMLASACFAQDAAVLGEGDAHAAELLSSLRRAYAGIEQARGGDALELRIQFDVAIGSLTALWQLYGIDWAQERLRALYADPDCPELHMGYSPSRRLLLRIEPLELKNPDFADYTVLLCTLESLHEADIEAAKRGQLQLQRLDGSQVEATVLDESHPLWERLKEQAGDFRPPHRLMSGHSLVFKQLFMAEGLGREAISAVSLDWADQRISLGWFENEVRID